MKNREKFEKEILEIACFGGRLAKKDGKLCNCTASDITCDECDFKCDKDCNVKIKEWCEQEYTGQPNVDWSKVPIDTPIFVRDDDEDRWTKRHFYKYVNGRIRTFDGGKTSFTSNNFDDKDGMYAETTCWLQGKLTEEGETHND